MQSKNEPTKPSKPASSSKPGASPERAKYLLDDLVKSAKAGQVKLAHTAGGHRRRAGDPSLTRRDREEGRR
jgi:hypothetical protein